MNIQIIKERLAICKLENFSLVDFNDKYFFIGKTDEENSLVCSEYCIPRNATEISKGWRAFRVAGTMEFSLVGILSKISGILADCKIGIFAVSTYNTDYVLTKEENFQKAIDALEKEDICVCE